MTLFEAIVPLGALALAGIGILYIQHEDRKLDAQIAQEAERRR